jgi:hypothetical protein
MSTTTIHSRWFGRGVGSAGQQGPSNKFNHIRENRVRIEYHSQSLTSYWWKGKDCLSLKFKLAGVPRISKHAHSSRFLHPKKSLLMQVTKICHWAYMCETFRMCLGLAVVWALLHDVEKCSLRYMSRIDDAPEGMDCVQHMRYLRYNCPQGGSPMLLVSNRGNYLSFRQLD